jgi:hypothetical protein
LIFALDTSYTNSLFVLDLFLLPGEPVNSINESTLGLSSEMLLSFMQKYILWAWLKAEKKPK